jgi:Ni/Fe-hydrogenase subunit HybB-like protein
MGTTWDDLENTKLVRVQIGPAVSDTTATKRWWHGLSGLGKWVFGIVSGIIAGVAVLLIRSWLISQGVVAP